MAPKVWHMLESGMMEVNDEVPVDRLPTSVNEVRLLSLENLKMIAKKLSGENLVEDKMYSIFCQIKTNTDAVKVYCLWMRTLDTSALPSKLIPELVRWSTDQAKV